MPEYLIVGLGNPGEKYQKTRHNIGWMVSNAINIEKSTKWKLHKNLYLFSNFSMFGKNVINAIPVTYMNNSGMAVKELLNKYKIPINNVIVIVDEYNFPVGKVHIKKCGSNGGHNGIASIIEETESNDFLKLRCGIGKDFPSGGMVDYVLSDFPETQQTDVMDMIDKAIDSIEHIIKVGFSRAMSDINSERLWKEEKKDVRDDN